MVYYIDRLCSLYPAFTITTLTVHRFLITAAIELEFLYRVDWKIVPNPEVLVDYYRGLVERSDGYILESDVAPSNAEPAMQGEVEQKEEMANADGAQADATAETNTQWNQWMKDVAGGSTTRDDGATSNALIDNAIKREEDQG